MKLVLMSVTVIMGNFRSSNGVIINDAAEIQTTIID